MSAELPSDAPAPRLCHLVKWPDFDGYGFNLHAEKAKSGQFIGKVDDDSPADHAGLKEGDRIIEVNGVNIANENHRQVVERIKAVPNETKLLVLDTEADRWYKERKVVVKNSLQNVKYIKTPVPRPTGGNKSEAKPKVESNVPTHTNGSASSPHSETQSLADSSRSSTPKTEPKQDSPRSTPAESPRPAAPAHAPKAQNGDAALNNNNNNNNNNTSNGSATTGGGGGLTVPNGVTTVISTPPPASRKVHVETKAPVENKAPAENVKAAAPAPATTNGNSKPPVETANGTKAPAEGAAGLNLNMSAAQMREMLANRKKNDPKKNTMDMREKYQIVQQM